MAKEEHVELEGTVVEVRAGGNFHVQIDGSDQVVLAYLSGKIRKNKIRVILGDKVTVAFSPYDGTRGMIKYRNR